MTQKNRVAAVGSAPARLLLTAAVLALGAGGILPRLPGVEAAREQETAEGAIRQIQRLDRDTGYALTGRELLVTHDGGRTWSDVAPRRLPSGAFVFFADATRGFVAGVDPRNPERLVLLSTVDGGASWREHSPAGGAEGGGPFASARTQFVDAERGFFLGQRATSSALSVGELFRTDDGGETWMRLPAPPAAGPLVFVDATRGFMTGAPVPERLYRTVDGGRSWREVSLGLGVAPGRALYALPVFRSPEEGSLAVTLRGPRPRLLTFVTRDGGRTWLRGPTRALPRADYDEPFPTVADAAGRVRLLDLSPATSRGAGMAGASVVEVAADPVGESWALTAEGACNASGCRQVTGIVALPADSAAQDGSSPTRLLARSQILPVVGRKSPSFGAAAASISTKKGFDKCAAASAAQMQTWWTASPYYDANIYMGGTARGCAQPYLNAAWVKTVFAQGWRLIPTWVGPQSPCSTFSKRFSGDAALARNQGLAEADAAAAAALALGLGAGTPVYYDLEHYTAGGSCSTAVRAFVSAWAERLRARGYLSGVYGSASNTQADWRPDVLASPLDAVWVASWACASGQTSCGVNPSVFGLAPLSDAYYANDQRLRQYWGGHSETWGGVTFNVDANIARGPVAAPGAVGLPDVVVDSLSSSPANPKAGDPVTFTAVVRNAGSAPTPTGVDIGVAYRIDGAQVTWGAVPGPLAAGASVTVATQGGAWSATVGSHALLALADDLHRFAESDEGNNERSLGLLVVADPCRSVVAADRWKGEYFAGRDLAGASLLVRDEGAAGLAFDWGSGSPDPSCGVPVDGFSSRFTRTVDFAAGRYRFTVTGDDGVRLFVAGALVLDEWRDQVATFSKDVTLAAGQNILVLEHYENLGGAQARLSWASLEPVVVDDGDPGFELLQTATGKPEWWHKETGVGYGNDMVWTTNTLSRKDNYARWKPVLPGAGRYRVEAFVPRSHASTTKAAYKVLAGGVTTTKVVNQAPLYDAWADLGTHAFRADGTEWVELGDATGETSNSKQIAFDALRFTPADAPLSDGGWSFPVGSADGGAGWRVTLPLGASWTAASGQQYNGHLAEDWSRLDGKSLGQPVYAAADGEVVVAKQNCGNYVDVVVLKHQVAGLGEIYSMYGHIETTVKVGDRLKRRQQMGVLGNPVTFGPHLHFEVKDRAALVNKPFSGCAVPAQGVYVSAGYSGKRNDYAGGDFWDPSNDGVVGNRYYHPTRFILSRGGPGAATIPRSATP